MSRRRDAMEIEITEKQWGARVLTTVGETCYVPGDVVDGGMSVPIRNSELRDFVDGEIEDCEAVFGYFGRWQMPGYLDCTDWDFDTNKRRLMQSLRQH